MWFERIDVIAACLVCSLPDFLSAETLIMRYRARLRCLAQKTIQHLRSAHRDEGRLAGLLKIHCGEVPDQFAFLGGIAVVEVFGLGVSIGRCIDITLILHIDFQYASSYSDLSRR